MMPDVHSYLDYRAFLADWFKAKKEAQSRFSHRGFARRIGQKSPSIVVDVIAGRRNLTSELAAAFASAMKLGKADTRFFLLLVSLDRAGTPDEKSSIWTEITASQRFQAAHKLEGESFRYLSDWSYPAIRELARRPDFRADPAWIAETLRPPISRKKAASALEALFDLGMLVEGSRGEIVQADGAIVTPREVLGLAVDNYHSGMLERAIAGIRDFKAAERHYTGVTVCIPSSSVPEIKAEINRFAERLLELCDGAEGTPERVYQLHLLAFPLSSDSPVDPPKKENT
jgi:uncharacterized protein (TIGR02147 family)